MSGAAPGPGAVIGGRYTLVRRLGAGGFGAVWLAQDAQARGIDRPVALKLLHAELAALRGRDYARFVREAEILARLDHPSITRALDYDVDGEHAFIVMEHVDGLPLDRVLSSAARRGGPLEARDAGRIFEEMCSAVAYAHDLGIVHRDLKPKNVMIVRRAERLFVKVLDFGIARVAGEAGDGGTTVGRVIGSYYYMAPEQVRGERVDARADVFALGCMLYELLTGHRAWARTPDGAPLPAHLSAGKAPPNTLGDITTRILTDERPRPSDVVEGLPLGLDEVVRRAMAIAVEQRFASVTALAAAARPLLAEQRSETHLTVVALEADVREALLRELPRDGTPRSSEDVERVAPPVVVAAPANIAPPANMAPANMAPANMAPANMAPPVDTASVGSVALTPPPRPRPRQRALLLAVGAASLASAGVVFATATLRARERPPRAVELPSDELAATASIAHRNLGGPAARALVGAAVARARSATAAIVEGRSPPIVAHGAPAPAASEPAADPTVGGGPPTSPSPSEAIARARPATTTSPTRSAAASPAPSAPAAPRAPATASAPAAPSPAPDRADGAALLTRLLAEARARPSDLRAANALADAIRAEALRRPADIRTRTLRLVETSVGDVEGLAAAVAVLERAGGGR